MYFVTFLDEKFSEVRTVLSGNSCDEGHFLVFHIYVIVLVLFGLRIIFLSCEIKSLDF